MASFSRRYVVPFGSGEVVGEASTPDEALGHFEAHAMIVEELEPHEVRTFPVWIPAGRDLAGIYVVAGRRRRA